MYPRLPILVTGLQAAAGTAMTGMTGSTAYFVYHGRLTVPTTITDLMVKLHNGSAGATITSAEMGLFSTPSAPTGAGQTLTKIGSATVSDMATAGPAWVTAGGALSLVIPAGTFLWIGVRVAATTMPKPSGTDCWPPLGQFLTTASATAFASGSTYTGAYSSTVGSPIQPLLYARAA